MKSNYTYSQAYPGIAADEGWHEQLEQSIVELGEGAWGFIGYGTSNFGVVRSAHGYILIDTGDCPSRARQAVQQIAKLAPGALQAIILTHSHPDHRISGFVFLEGAQNSVPVYGHYKFGAEQSAGVGLEAVLGQRTAMQFGGKIPDDLYVDNFMVPRFANSETGPLAEPNQVVPEGGMELDIDGVHLQLLTLPTETPDHVQVWLPEARILFCADSAYGSFPNLYPLRGGPYRDVETWGANVRKLAELKPAAILCGHVIAVCGEAEVASFLDDYASALEYVYTETIRGMNEGKTADQLAVEICLPEHLRHKPYLAEYYGNVGWSVRAIFAHKVGWFSGKPSAIANLAPLEEAQRIAALAGGADVLLQRAREALAAGDERWAARLGEMLLVLADASEMDTAATKIATATATKANAATAAEVRSLLASAYEAMAAKVLPITAKNYLQTAALDLRA